MRRYVEEMVTRYRDSPAIWMWELGNEYCLGASLPNAEIHRPPARPELGTPSVRDERDDLSFGTAREIFKAFAEAVRKHDPHRLIGTGDSILRPSAWHQMHKGTWADDSPEQSAEMLAFVNPDPVDVISVHAYARDYERFDDLLKACRRLGKPVFVGEFGVKGTGPEQTEDFGNLLAAIIEKGVPLSAIWVFDLPRQTDFNLSLTNDRAWQLEAIARANRKLEKISPRM
jgi:endo-1,4-beta-mannosidase